MCLKNWWTAEPWNLSIIVWKIACGIEQRRKKTKQQKKVSSSKILDWNLKSKSNWRHQHRSTLELESTKNLPPKNKIKIITIFFQRYVRFRNCRQQLEVLLFTSHSSTHHDVDFFSCWICWCIFLFEIGWINAKKLQQSCVSLLHWLVLQQRPEYTREGQRATRKSSNKRTNPNGKSVNEAFEKYFANNVVKNALLPFFLS